MRYKASLGDPVYIALVGACVDQLHDKGLVWHQTALKSTGYSSVASAIQWHLVGQAIQDLHGLMLLGIVMKDRRPRYAGSAGWGASTGFATLNDPRNQKLLDEALQHRNDATVGLVNNTNKAIEAAVRAGAHILSHGKYEPAQIAFDEVGKIGPPQ
jgi:hypothetical protein